MLELTSISARPPLVAISACEKLGRMQDALGQWAGMDNTGGRSSVQLGGAVDSCMSLCTRTSMCSSDGVTPDTDEHIREALRTHAAATSRLLFLGLYVSQIPRSL